MARSWFPHPLTLLTGCVLAAAMFSYVLPAGEFDREVDPVLGRSVVVAGTYHTVDPDPVGPFEAVVAIPRGLIEAADVVFLVLLIGGAFTVVDQTGALKGGVSWLVARLGHRDLLIIPVVAMFFAAGGIIENMQEEIIALVPVLLVLVKRLGFTPLVAVAMSAGSAFVGSSFSPINPFQVQIAQNVAELPLLSGASFRSVFLALALVIWIGGVMRLASRTRGERQDIESVRSDLTGRDTAVLGLVAVTFIILVYGIMKLSWGFNEMSALFFVMGVIAGVIARMGITRTAEAYVDGFRSMAYAAVLIGFARAIYVVLEDGRIVDTIVNAVFTPLQALPVGLSALGMMVAHIGIHVPVPSVSGQAVLTMPLLVPLSDLLGLSRQVTVLAYQYGAGLTDLVTPTNGALLAILAAGGVSFQDWFRFTFPRFLLLLGLGGVSILTAILVDLT